MNVYVTNIQTQNNETNQTQFQDQKNKIQKYVYFNGNFMENKGEKVIQIIKKGFISFYQNVYKTSKHIHIQHNSNENIHTYQYQKGNIIQQLYTNGKNEHLSSRKIYQFYCQTWKT
eukprot:TRINITY_DN6355_c0_g2_i2.p3 TRINITY_DN6355_c0_g2~~TRINITY_DN6355_c0_g2_i2.p3  ORF type:complete len:116 (+),score=0.38 TRINITY_DN6355_c0_g2_i2:275-622(+)